MPTSLWAQVRYLACLGAALGLCGGMEGVAMTQEPRVVGVPVASVYADIYDDSERVTQVVRGEVVLVEPHKRYRSLVKVAVPNQYRQPQGYPGWMEGDCLLPLGASPNQLLLPPAPTPSLRPWSLANDPQEPSQLLIIDPEVGLYPEPDLESEPLDLLLAGSIITPAVPRPFSQDGPDFWAIHLPDFSDTYYIPAHSASTTTLPLAPLDLLDSAFKFEGSPYLWGGMSCHGIDCSGLVYQVFKLHGLIVPRDADQQFQVGEIVETDQLQPGDLVFFGSSPQKVGHVGFYLGEDQFWDASGRQGVAASSLLDPKYRQTFLGGRRYWPQ